VLARSSLDIEPGVLGWQAAGDAAVEAVAIGFADGEAGSLEVARAEISALQAESPLRLAADTLTLAGLDLSLSRSFLLALMQGGDTTTEAGVDASVAPPVSTGPNAGEARGERSPAGGDSAKPKIDVSRIQALLAELGHDPGPIDGLMGRRTASAIRSFQTAEGLSVDGRIDAGLLAALERRAEPPAQTEPQPPVQIGAGASIPVEWRLGRLSLPGNPMVHFRDDLVSPNVVVDARFSRLEVQDLDSQEPGQRALLDVAAEINERTELTLSGWIAGLAAPSELEIQAEVADLQLATYSPYAAAFAGVPLDGGRLDAATDLKAAAGNLEGELRLEIDQIAFGSANEADPQRVGGAGGVPLRTAVDLLADADGRISLALPITGTVASPDIDIGPAVNKAIGGVLQTVFPPTLVASILADLTKGDGPSLDAMEFAPGSAELTQAHRRYADDVAKLAKQRPRLSLKVCGRATAKDVAAPETKSQPAMRDAEGRQPTRAEPEPAPVALGAPDEQALHELAVERQRMLIAYLVERGGIDPARITECRATFDPTDQGNPRVEVLF
jgi:peptidoglycan hydrolase-like protein with peptidoglycan-binding domain